MRDGIAGVGPVGSDFDDGIETRGLSATREASTRGTQDGVQLVLKVLGPALRVERDSGPNHPFWVDVVRDYVPLGELEVGTILHVQGGGEVILVSKTWRQGDFEVEGLHNFYVRGEGRDVAGVLVHNSTGKKNVLNVGSGENPMPDAINMDIRPGPGVDVVGDANAMAFGNATMSEVHAINPHGFNPGGHTGSNLIEVDLNQGSRHSCSRFASGPSRSALFDV